MCIYIYIYCVYIIKYIQLVGGLEHFLFFHVLGIIIPTDFHIFQRGRYTTNQYKQLCSHVLMLHHLLIESISHPRSEDEDDDDQESVVGVWSRERVRLETHVPVIKPMGKWENIGKPIGKWRFTLW